MNSLSKLHLALQESDYGLTGKGTAMCNMFKTDYFITLGMTVAARLEDNGGSNKVRYSTIQNEEKLTDLANLKHDQGSQHIMKYGNKDSRNSTEDKQVKF
jgi:hypothetical protein